MPRNHKEAKRLAKAVRRRRLFAEQLRVEANATRARAHTLDGHDAAQETAFADRLDEIATREFAAASKDEQMHARVADTVRSLVQYTSIGPDQEARMKRAGAALAERGSIARIEHMCRDFGIDATGSPGEVMKRIEHVLDANDMGTPEQRAGMTLGQRINHAETLFYTRPRF